MTFVCFVGVGWWNLCVCNNRSGWKLVGDAGTDAVLCTENETYSVVRVETSNDVFLVPPATPAETADAESDTFEVTARCNYYYEVSRPCMHSCSACFISTKSHMLTLAICSTNIYMLCGYL